MVWLIGAFVVLPLLIGGLIVLGLGFATMDGTAIVVGSLCALAGFWLGQKVVDAG